MKLFYALLTGLAAASAAWGQAEVPARPKPATVDCRSCHTSDAPTREKPSLVECPRAKARGQHAPHQAPRSITLGAPGGAYAPVEFSHKAHAEMAEMDGGCYQCHHYDQGGTIQKCGACHSAERARTDIGKPDLRGAMHRLCVECHRAWGPTDCATCHGDKPLPKVEAPDRVIYETGSDRGSIVTFSHRDHARRFGLDCAGCHRRQSCASCHDPLKKAVPPPARPAHQDCFGCHGKDKCSNCHSSKPMGSFDHGKTTGWMHNRFHRRLECARCHTTPGKFTKTANDCESCHKGWQTKFDHQKTGLQLDETHAALGCADCHADPSFARAPACQNCHEKSYPKDKPGKLVGGAGMK